MVTATDPKPQTAAPDDRHWLTRQAPTWLKPLAVGLAVLDAGLLIAQAGLIAHCLARLLTESASPQDLIGYLIWLVPVILLRAMVVFIRSALAERASASIRARLRKQLFRRMSQADPVRAGRFETGALTHRLTDRIERLDPYYSRFFVQQYSALIIPLLLVIWISSLNWLAGLLLAITAPIIPLFMALIGRGAARLSEDQAQVTAQLAGLFHDRLRGLDVVQRLAAGPRVMNWLAERAEDYRERTMRVLRLAFLSSAVLEFFAAVAIAALAIYIGLSLIGYIEIGPSDRLTLASGLMILLLAPDFFLPLRQLAQHWHDRADALAASADLRPLGEVPLRAGTGDEASRSDRIAWDRSLNISARGLGFRYATDTPLIEHLDLEFEPGSWTLITGPSGSGKTTLLMLLAGFLQPDRGQIRYGSRSIAGMDDANLAGARAWMGQRSVIFDASLRENLILGRANVNQAALEQALRLAQLDQLVASLENGLKTGLGPGGCRLSGGQARRLVLARALLNSPPILFLDEASEHLDNAGEQALWSSLDQARRQLGLTVIAVSHRPAASLPADRVLRLSSDAGIEVLR